MLCDFGILRNIFSCHVACFFVSLFQGLYVNFFLKEMSWLYHRCFESESHVGVWLWFLLKKCFTVESDDLHFFFFLPFRIKTTTSSIHYNKAAITNKCSIQIFVLIHSTSYPTCEGVKDLCAPNRNTQKAMQLRVGKWFGADSISAREQTNKMKTHLLNGLCFLRLMSAFLNPYPWAWKKLNTFCNMLSDSCSLEIFY